MKRRKPSGIHSIQHLQDYLNDIEGNIPASKTITVRIPFHLWMQFIRDRINGNFSTLNDYLLFRLGEKQDAPNDVMNEEKENLINQLNISKLDLFEYGIETQTQKENHQTQLIKINNRLVDLYDEILDFDKGIPYESQYYHGDLHADVKKHNSFLREELSSILSELEFEEEEDLDEEE